MEFWGVLIDIGVKIVVYIFIQEMLINCVDDFEEVFQFNEIWEFFILIDENEDGQFIFFICWIEYMWVWEWVR